MKTNNLNDLIEARADVELVSEVIKMMVNKMEKEKIDISYRFVLMRLADVLQKATTTIWSIESDEMEVEDV